MGVAGRGRCALLCYALALLSGHVSRAGDARETDRLLDDFVATFDHSKLLPLAERMTPDEISALLRKRPRVVEGIAKAHASLAFQRLTRAERESYHAADSVVDSAGALHLVVSANYEVHQPGPSGIKVRWATEVHVLTLTNGRWGAPQKLSMGDLYVHQFRLLADREDTLWLFGLASNNNATEPVPGVEKGRYSIFCSRRRREGEWSRPEFLVPEPLRLPHGFDVCLAPSGEMHLVWAQWEGNARPETLRHRVCPLGGATPLWQQEEVLPSFPERHLSGPRLSCTGAELHVFAGAQALGEGDIGVAYLRFLRRWQPPTLIHQRTGFDSYLRPVKGSARPRIAVPDAVASDRCRWPIYEAQPDGSAREVAEFALPLSSRLSFFEDMLNACASDPEGRTYALADDGGNVLLLRIGEQGRTEGVCLVTQDALEDAAVLRGDLEFVDGGYRAWWVLSEGHGLPHRLYSCEARLPERGWLRAPELLGRLRAGRTLYRSDTSMMALLMTEQAERDAESGKFLAAIDRYVYVACHLANGSHWATAERQLRNWHYDGITEVRRRLARRLIGKPELLREPDRYGWGVTMLARQLGVDPQGDKAVWCAELPAQSDQDIRARLDSLAWPPFVVTVRGRFAVRITPDRYVLQGADRRASARDGFEQHCRKLLASVQRPEEVPELVLFTTHTSPVPGGTAMPPMHHRLKDYAKIEILPPPK